MKRLKIGRVVTGVLLLGGWTLSAASLYVIRTPGHLVILPKDRLGFHDTFVDTRHWTLADVRMHPAVVARVIHLGRYDLLSNTVDARGDVQAQLADAISHPTDAPSVPSPILQKVKADMHAAATSIKSVFD